MRIIEEKLIEIKEEMNELGVEKRNNIYNK